MYDWSFAIVVDSLFVACKFAGDCCVGIPVLFIGYQCLGLEDESCCCPFMICSFSVFI